MAFILKTFDDTKTFFATPTNTFVMAAAVTAAQLYDNTANGYGANARFYIRYQDPDATYANPTYLIQNHVMGPDYYLAYDAANGISQWVWTNTPAAASRFILTANVDANGSRQIVITSVGGKFMTSKSFLGNPSVVVGSTEAVPSSPVSGLAVPGFTISGFPAPGTPFIGMDNPRNFVGYRLKTNGGKYLTTNGLNIETQAQPTQTTDPGDVYTRFSPANDIAGYHVLSANNGYFFSYDISTGTIGWKGGSLYLSANFVITPSKLRFGRYCIRSRVGNALLRAPDAGGVAFTAADGDETLDATFEMLPANWGYNSAH